MTEELHAGGTEPLADRADPVPVLDREIVFEGMVWDVRRDHVDLGQEQVKREIVQHPGAVAVVALDDAGQIALVQQYRHPVGTRTWEIPAGLLDVDGEEPQLAAARELAEEADLRAEQWHVLLDYFTSPGFTDETIRIFLARGITQLPEAERHQRTGEERDMLLRWVSLDAAATAVLEGRLHNPHTVIGVLAAHARRDNDWADLEPADSPWPEWERLRAARADSSS